ncbi:hypothetical protein AJ79_08761 [Helicocarpus griseus UAMH5409]|uniref:Uncharacterized protein n=1 Tax=Helicocarpus griseus UAMH5409 TaxID=1447875 RepID=A0A2B7WQ45_9EURO|nr:hypothetical protein AJ79_08761 [Helicocarpus griseus UAMH5409]
MSFKSSMPWAKYDGGLVDGSGIAIRKCSTGFLSALCSTYLGLTGERNLEVKDAEADILFEGVMKEFCRLAFYPSLFPSAETQERFWVLLLQANQQLAVTKQERNEGKKAELRRRANMIAREEDTELQNLNRPSYKPDLLPWEQFLLRDSPGSGMDLPSTTPNATMQLMPIGGVALHLRWMKDRYLTWKRCQKTDIPKRVKRGSQALRPTKASTLNTTPSFDCILKVLNHQCYPASSEKLPSRSGLDYEHTWKFASLPRNRHVVDRLENFNDVIEALEGVEPADFNINPMGTRAMYYHSRNYELS